MMLSISSVRAQRRKGQRSKALVTYSNVSSCAENHYFHQKIYFVLWFFSYIFFVVCLTNNVRTVPRVVHLHRPCSPDTPRPPPPSVVVAGVWARAPKSSDGPSNSQNLDLFLFFIFVCAWSTISVLSGHPQTHPFLMTFSISSVRAQCKEDTKSNHAKIIVAINTFKFCVATQFFSWYLYFACVFNQYRPWLSDPSPPRLGPDAINNIEIMIIK